MKRMLTMVFLVVMMVCSVSPASASIYDSAEPYIINVMNIIAKDPENNLGTLTEYHFCRYNDIKKAYAYKDENAPFEKAFLLNAEQIPKEGYIFHFQFKDTFIALVSLDGVIISIQNMTKNAELNNPIVNCFGAIDKSKVNNEELLKFYDFCKNILYQNIALAYINFDAGLFSDFDMDSNVLNVWH